MRVSHSEGLARHIVPESCRCLRKRALEALTGERMGRVLSRERNQSGVLTTFMCPEDNTECIVIARYVWTPRGQRPRARMEAPRTEPGRSHHWPCLLQGPRDES